MIKVCVSSAAVGFCCAGEAPCWQLLMIWEACKSKIQLFVTVLAISLCYWPTCLKVLPDSSPVPLPGRELRLGTVIIWNFDVQFKREQHCLIYFINLCYVKSRFISSDHLHTGDAHGNWKRSWSTRVLLRLFDNWQNFFTNTLIQLSYTFRLLCFELKYSRNMLLDFKYNISLN